MENSTPMENNGKPSTTTTTTTRKMFQWSKFTDVLLTFSFLYMTYNAFEGLLKADSYGTIIFIVTAYTSLVLLFWCLQEFDKTPQQESKKKQRLKLAIATLAMILNVTFTYRVATILDSTIISIVVWTMAAVVTVGGFYGLFFMPQVANNNNATPDVKRIML